MISYTTTENHFGRVLELGRNLTEAAFNKGLSATKSVALPVLGSDTGVAGSAMTERTALVSFSQPTPSQFETQLWVNPINKRVFKSIPTEPGWKLVYTRQDAFFEANTGSGAGGSGTTPPSGIVGQPIDSIPGLLALDTNIIPDKTMIYVESVHAIYAIDIQSTEPTSPTVLAPNAGPGRWYLITTTSDAIGNIDGGLF